MKRKKAIILGATIALFSVPVLTFGYLWLDLIDAFGVNKARKLSYYKDDANYYSASGIITEVHEIGEDGCRIHMADISCDQDIKIYDSHCFAINYIGANELWEVWQPQVGMTISFISAPEIFYDGYQYPIVSVSFEDNEVLSFEVGKTKLLEYIQKH